MGVLVSEQGFVASWGGAASEAEGLLAAIAPASFDLSVTGDTSDITTSAPSPPTGRRLLPLRKSWTASIEGALAGYHGGSVCTIASGGSEYDVHVQNFGLTIAAGVVETTELGAASPDDVWKVNQPTLITVSATLTAMVDSATALTLPPDFGATNPSTFTVTYKSGHTIAFPGFYSAVNIGVPNDGLQTVAYTIQGVGAVTYSGVETPLFAAGAHSGTPDYSSIALVMHSDENNTYSGDAFWHNIALTCDRNSVTRVSVQATGTGELVVAAS